LTAKNTIRCNHSFRKLEAWMIKYVFREPLTIKSARRANPQRIGEVLERISKENGGRLTPAATVAAARAERHPLHRHFEWSDAAAAEQYRLDQARTLIRSIRVFDTADPDRETRIAFVSIANGRDGRSYYSMSAVEASRQLQALVLVQAERDLEAWERRYSELADVCQTIKTLRETIAERRERLGLEAPPQ
jgi:hypothetical protein